MNYSFFFVIDLKSLCFCDIVTIFWWRVLRCLAWWRWGAGVLGRSFGLCVVKLRFFVGLCFLFGVRCDRIFWEYWRRFGVWSTARWVGCCGASISVTICEILLLLRVFDGAESWRCSLLRITSPYMAKSQSLLQIFSFKYDILMLLILMH